MGSPSQHIVCSICKAVFDATQGAWAWFVTDAAVTPVRGQVCADCRGTFPLELGHTVDRRSEEGEPSA